MDFMVLVRTVGTSAQITQLVTLAFAFEVHRRSCFFSLQTNFTIY